MAAHRLFSLAVVAQVLQRGGAQVVQPDGGGTGSSAWRWWIGGGLWRVVGLTVRREEMQIGYEEDEPPASAVAEARARAVRSRPLRAYVVCVCVCAYVCAG